MNTGWAICAALAAAMSFAVAAVLQQEAAQSEPAKESLHLQLLLSLLHRKKWIAGIVVLIAGYGFQALALANGPVALVQPIIVTELAFAIPLAMWRNKHDAGPREWLGIGMVLAGIGTFLVVASPSEGIATPSLFVWLASLVPVAGLVLLAISAAIRVKGRARPMLLGVAAGLAFSLLAILTKSVAYLIAQQPAKLFTSWQLYAVIGLGIVALVISQSAYQAGPLAYSMPFIGVLEPLVAVVIGDTALNEEIQLSPGLFALEALAALVAVVGIVALTTSPIVLSIYEDEKRTQPGVADTSSDAPNSSLASNTRPTTESR